MNSEAYLQQLEAEHERLQLAYLQRLERENQRLRLRALERENRELKKQREPVVKPAIEKPKAKATAGKIIPPSYPWMVRCASFQSMSRPRIVKEQLPTWDEKFEKYKKARAAEFRAFCKPKGINSILKGGDFTTGRFYRQGKQHEDGEIEWLNDGYAELARMKKLDGVWVSVVDERADGYVYEDVPQEQEGIWQK